MKKRLGPSYKEKAERRRGGPRAPKIKRGQYRVGLVTQWYAPEPVSVPVLTARELKRAGFSVEVLTGIPNLPDGTVHSPYKAWKSYDEGWEGVRVIRAPLYPNHSRSASRRMANYLTWALSATVVGWGMLRKSDVNVVHCTPATAAIPALLARWLTGTPYVVVVQDLWPDTVSASGFVRNIRVNDAIARVLNIAVNSIYGNAAQIVVISDGMGEVLEQRGFDPGRITRIFNSVDEDIFLSGEGASNVRDDFGVSNESFVLVYAGNQGVAQDLAPLVRAVAALESVGVALLLVGWGVEREFLRELAVDLSAGNIQFIDRVSPAEVSEIQASSDLSVVSLSSDRLFEITIPSKLQTLLASGRTVLGIVSGDARKVIADSGAGVVAAPGDENSIKEAIESARSHSGEQLKEMGRSGNRYYLSEMSSNQRSNELARVVKEAYLESPKR